VSNSCLGSFHGCWVSGDVEHQTQIRVDISIKERFETVEIPLIRRGL